MTNKLLTRTACGLLIPTLLAAPPARAQDESAVVGVYCLVGVREMGSCIRLSPGGKFEYFLSYGAYDERSEGTWKLQKGALVIDSLPYDRRPTFGFKRMQKSETSAYDVIVENAKGRPLNNFEVHVTCDGEKKYAGVTGTVDFKVDCKSAPTAVALELSVFNVAPQTIDVAGRAGAERAYVFGFEPGDLGKRAFRAHRVQITADGALVMASPVPEMKNVTFRYEREQQR